ncbi:hypothetical protein CWE07_04770 [Aliidiomarina maris]|uniref:Uncharacterized protein n=1 Tax=Aliidiomarina maris TaxID=531312 RepID=A0ABY0BTJ3_9GAMM|nr:hypothetical protein CWE07_04770 [Aliidiomarina maris]
MLIGLTGKAGIVKIPAFFVKDLNSLADTITVGEKMSSAIELNTIKNGSELTLAKEMLCLYT